MADKKVSNNIVHSSKYKTLFIPTNTFFIQSEFFQSTDLDCHHIDYIVFTLLAFVTAVTLPSFKQMV